MKVKWIVKFGISVIFILFSTAFVVPKKKVVVGTITFALGDVFLKHKAKNQWEEKNNQAGSLANTFGKSLLKGLVKGALTGNFNIQSTVQKAVQTTGKEAVIRVIEKE